MSRRSSTLQSAAFSRAHRVLHWLIAFTFLFILLTVCLRMGWLNKRHVGDILMSEFAERHIMLSEQDAVAIGKAVRQPMWNMHIWAGYFLMGLYIIRLLVMKIEGPVFGNPFSKKLRTGERLKAAVYLVFYICLGISLLTGIYIELVGKVQPAIYQWMKTVHIQSLYYAFAFTFLHLIGLVIAELGSQSGIISRMIHGKQM